MLSCGGLAVDLSFDHKATDPREKARIEAAGGYVGRKGRVMNVLAIARAFGDIEYKKCKQVRMPDKRCPKLPASKSALLHSALER